MLGTQIMVTMIWGYLLNIKSVESAHRGQHLEGLPAALGNAQVAVHGVAQAALRHAVEAPVGVPGDSCSLAVASWRPHREICSFSTRRRPADHQHLRSSCAEFLLSVRFGAFWPALSKRLGAEIRQEAGWWQVVSLLIYNIERSVGRTPRHCGHHQGSDNGETPRCLPAVM